MPIFRRLPGAIKDGFGAVLIILNGDVDDVGNEGIATCGRKAKGREPALSDRDFGFRWPV